MIHNKLISIVIPALRRPDLTQRCVDSLEKQTRLTGSFEIIVVENEARPESVLHDPLPSHVRRLILAENRGTTGSINRGIADSSSKYVLLLNNDVELDPKFLPTLVSALEENERYGFATGKLLKASERNRLDGAGDALLLGGGAFRLGHSDLDIGQFDRQCCVLAGCGAATLFRRSVLPEVKGLDEDFFAYLDDVDLALRAQLLGHGGVYVPDAVAYHIGSATLGSPFHPKIVEWVTRNQMLLVAKNYPGAVLVRLLPQIVVFQVLWLGIVLRRAKLLSYTKGMIGAVCLLPRTLQKRRQLMASRRISNSAFMNLLCASEKQVFDWQNALPPARRSTLLRIYFSLFGGSY